MKKYLLFFVSLLFFSFTLACSNGAVNNPICDQCALGLVMSGGQCVISCPQPVPMFSTTLCFDKIKVQSLIEQFSNVHFIGGGNNFGGGIFWLTRKSLSPRVTVMLGSQSRQCGQQIRGIYYNNQRGQRLRPLDNDTLSTFRQNDSGYNLLNIIGGWYTSCSGGSLNDIYSIYGQIRYTGIDTGSLTAGVSMDYTGNSLGTGFRSSLQYVDNKNPLGYIYDSQGGIGFIGGLLDNIGGHVSILQSLVYTSINNIATVTGGIISIATSQGTYNIASGNTQAGTNTIWNFFIKGVTSLGRNLSREDRRTVLGNPKNAGSIVNADAVSNASILNSVSRKASALCKGKKTYTVSQFTSSLPAGIVCIKDELPRKQLVLDLSLADYLNKTYILSSVDVVLKNSMVNTSQPLRIFVDKGNVFFDTAMIGSGIYFDNKGNPSGFGFGGVFVKGVVIVNGLILGTGSNNYMYPRRLVFHGKISSLNSPLEPQSGRISQIRNVIGSGFEQFINLQNVFVRECDSLNGKGTDGTSCNGTGELIRSPLILVDKTWKSDLLD